MKRFLLVWVVLKNTWHLFGCVIKHLTFILVCCQTPASPLFFVRRIRAEDDINCLTVCNLGSGELDHFGLEQCAKLLIIRKPIQESLAPTKKIYMYEIQAIKNKQTDLANSSLLSASKIFCWFCTVCTVASLKLSAFAGSSNACFFLWHSSILWMERLNLWAFLFDLSVPTRASSSASDRRRGTYVWYDWIWIHGAGAQIIKVSCR